MTGALSTLLSETLASFSDHYSTFPTTSGQLKNPNYKTAFYDLFTGSSSGSNSSHKTNNTTPLRNHFSTSKKTSFLDGDPAAQQNCSSEGDMVHTVLPHRSGNLGETEDSYGLCYGPTERGQFESHMQCDAGTFHQKKQDGEQIGAE